MDGIRELRKGETLEGIPADTWNAFVRCLKIVQGIKRQGNTPGVVSSALPFVEVFNRTGTDISARWPILRLDSPALTIDDGEHIPDEPILFDGTTPTVDISIGEIAVLQGPVLNNNTQAAVFVGPTWCEINVTDDTHEFARAGDADNTKLESSTSGAKIIWKESGTGTKKAVIMLGGGSAGEDVRYVVVITSGFIPPGTTTAPGDEDSGGATFTIKKFTAEEPATGYETVSFPGPTTNHIQNPFPYAANEGTYAIDYVGRDVSGGVHEFWRINGFDLTGLENWATGTRQVLLHEIGQPPSWGDAASFVGPEGPEGPPGTGDTVAEGYAIDIAGVGTVTIHNDPTEWTGFAADFQLFHHLAADTARTDPAWKTFTNYDPTNCTQFLSHISGTGRWQVISLTADVATAINAGTAVSPTSGSGTVYEVLPDGTTNSLGAKTLYNPFNHKVKGAVTVLPLSTTNFLIVGFDILEALSLLDGFAEKKTLAVPDLAGAATPTDIKWRGEPC